MSARKLYFALIGAIGVLGVLALIVIFGGYKMLSSKSANLVGLRLTQQALTKEQTDLSQSKRDIVKYTSLNNIAETIVPQEKNQALAVREITNYAQQANINISSITFPASNLGTSNSSTTSPSTGKTVAPPPSQLQRAAGISGIYILPITVQSDSNSPITYAQLITFLQALENNRHTAEVNQLTITPADPSGQHLSFSLVVNIYLK